MFAQIHRSGLLWPTLFMIMALAVLTSLGNWQWQRKAWKESLIFRLEQAATASAISLSEILAMGSSDEIRFRRVSLHGHFDHKREFHIWTPTPKGPAWRIITPLRLLPHDASKSQTLRYILIIRGSVDAAHKAPSTRRSGQIAHAVTLTGRIRLASTNWATPPPDLKANAWYALDIDTMRSVWMANAKLTSTSQPPLDIAPFYVEAETAETPPPAPQPNLKRLSLANRHLEYAVTWWGIAVTLIGVYAAFALTRLRRPSR